MFSKNKFIDRSRTKAHQGWSVHRSLVENRALYTSRLPRNLYESACHRTRTIQLGPKDVTRTSAVGDTFPVIYATAPQSVATHLGALSSRVLLA